MVNDQKFFEDLLMLCRKHKVNITQAKIDFVCPGVPHIPRRQFSWVDVTGAYEIRSDCAAIEAEEVITQAVTRDLIINGTEDE